MSQRTRFVLARAAIGTLGIYHAIIGLMMLFTPLWFFENIGNFPPFNRHYLGDFGAYQLPLGIALIFAAREPFKHRLLIISTIAANILHAFNHVYDDITTGLNWRWDTLALLVLGFVYLGVVFLKDSTVRQS